MLIENVLIRPQGLSEVSISWESINETTRSYLFINGAFAVGPFIADARGRTVVLPVPDDKTFKIEVHDVEDEEEIPAAIEEAPLAKPVIAWNTEQFDKRYHLAAKAPHGVNVGLTERTGFRRGGQPSIIELPVAPWRSASRQR